VICSHFVVSSAGTPGLFGALVDGFLEILQGPEDIMSELYSSQVTMSNILLHVSEAHSLPQGFWRYVDWRSSPTGTWRAAA
jgi:hypothetical protein